MISKIIDLFSQKNKSASAMKFSFLNKRIIQLFMKIFILYVKVIHMIKINNLIDQKSINIF